MNSILLAFDFGTKRIGVAVGQTITKTARPLDLIKTIDGTPPWDTIASLIKTWQPHALIVGIPYNMDGTDQPITHKAKQFADELQKRFDLPVHGVDERLTTKDARAQVFQKGGYKALKNTQVDSVAAQIILENWLTQDDHHD